MGGRRFVYPRLCEIWGHEPLAVVSRAESASPATGSTKAHAIEERQLLDRAFAASQ
jgi:2-oxoglutarate dehydrogenase complex dehydrogenase (E1) component-like enzyme